MPANQPGIPTRAAILVLLWLTGMAMRAPILVAAPLGPRIADALDLNQTGVGALTTLPVLALGLGAIPAAWLIARFGARNTLMMAVVLTGLASAARGAAPEATMLLTATAVTGLGIAIMQPALPALVARWCPGFVALGATVYLNGMMVGEFIGAGLTLPALLPAVGGGWRAALFALSLPIVVLAPFMLLPRLHGRRPTRDEVAHGPDWRDPRVWRFGGLLGLTASTFFGLNAYMDAVLASKQLSAHVGLVLGIFNAVQLFTSLFLMATIRRVLATPRLLFATVVIHVAGLAVVLVSGSLWLIAGVIAISFASAVQLIALTSLPSIVLAPERAGAVAAGMFAVGYVLAFVLPLCAGALIDASGAIDSALYFLIGLNLLCLPLGWTTTTGLEAQRA
ncbi:MFS transporter [Salinisphaera hydrothermalis]|uniref:MFS transporter n=1 Tax=Salinisphaera hydrothermalis (strain C41B8) TaxID=1304275 RepID=A0A084IKE4_SALHC|nr:MFS transporter [Salinisphaera hydrothermalis]KEZ77178.1 MFS transporter [Salinisphaera hydrothermalis C41B8]